MFLQPICVDRPTSIVVWLLEDRLLHGRVAEIDRLVEQEAERAVPADFEHVTVKPKRTNVTVKLVGLMWT